MFLVCLRLWPCVGNQKADLPVFCRKFFFTKHYFWLSDEPLTSESLASFLRSEKPEGKHSTAAWARETGKGLLFFAKRVEDKASPVGIINLVSTILSHVRRVCVDEGG